MKLSILLANLILAVGLAATASAADEHASPAIGGYDAVAYHTEGKAVRGSGYHAATHEGRTYLFASEANKKTFEKEPEKYLPAYGGWCAFGVAFGKKFHADPTAFAVVNGKLYLNLDKSIQEKWNVERAQNIGKADREWPKIEKVPAAKL